MIDHPADEPKDETAHPEAAHQALLKKFKRVNRALRTISAGNRTLLHASDEQALLHSMCQLIVDQGGYRMAVVGFAGQNVGKSIRWMTMVTAEKGVQRMDRAPFTWADTELGRTATCTAIRTGKRCVGRRILTDPAFAGPAYDQLRADAIARGYAAISAFPLRINGQVIGALAMAAEDADAFDDEEVSLLDELAADLEYGLGYLRMAIQNREAQAMLARAANYDVLTGLPNRSLLLERLQNALQHADANGGEVALLHLEISRFDEINKVLGYHAAEHLLQELGRRVAHCISTQEFLARVGQAKFAVLAPQGGAGHATQVAQRLSAALKEPVDVDGLMLDPQVGIGIALYPTHATEPEVLLRRADAAILNARTARGGYAMYTSGQEQEFTRRLALMADLRQAIEHDELQLYCQPKVSMPSGVVCGAEALVRWHHPVLGMLPTIDFIHLAEQSGLITPLTHWVLDAALRQSHAWHNAGLDRAMSINLSAHDLHDKGLIERLRGLFSKWSIPPEMIQFELTESALMVDPDGALETLTRLKGLGVELYIDDFGAGYSSLSYLQKLPVDWIKVDQSFVTPMTSNSDSAVIVRSTIELGHNLDLKVVAEGVESEAVWNSLAELGCDVAQGYFISTPMPAEQMKDWEGRRALHG
jgi:diguanylate cyclase